MSGQGNSAEVLKAAALNYWRKGHRIVPLKEKTPLVKWKKWQREEQSIQEFEELPWEKTDGFAIICGVKLNNKYYVGVLDLDVEKAGVPFSEEVLQKQQEVIDFLPITQLEGTPTEGRHLPYYSRTLVKTKTYDVCGVEILGEGKLCIMAPSRGYKRLNDNLPTELGSLNLKFEEAMEKAGLKPKPLSPPVSSPRKRRGRKRRVRYCIEMALKRDWHISHLMRLAIAAEYKRAGWSEDDIVNLFRTQADFDRKKCLTQVRSADPNKVATCGSIKEWGYCYPECPLYEWTQETVEKYLGKETYPILLETIGYTVKRDNIAKQLDLLHVLSMYAAPINELKEAPTSEGKTYPVMQIIRLFPREDIMVLGGLSPTALAHDYGVPVDPEGEDLRPAIQEIRGEIEKFKDEEVSAERNEKKRIKREIEKLQRKLYELMKGSKRLIDLENKVIIFVDNPDPRTWARLRPIMSHDLWDTTYKFTDRPHKGGPLKQVTAILRGWPVFIAFKAEETPNKGWTRDVWAQILTRGTTVPVEMSPEKYKEAIKLTGVRKGLPQPVVDRKLHMEEFRECRKIVRAIRQRILTLKKRAREQTGRRDLPNIFWMPFHDVVTENFPSKKGTYMREADRFLSIVQNHAVANVFNRPTLEINGVSYLVCTIHDLAKAVELYFSDEARKTIFGKIPTNQIKFFEEVILPLSKQWPGGIDTAVMQKKYKEVFDESISINTINYHYLQPLENMDLISRDDDPNDKRRKLTVPLREKVFNREAQIRILFEKGDIFTLENLKEAFSELKQLIVKDTPSNTAKIKDYDSLIIDIETLYHRYFSKNSIITGGSANNCLSEQGEELKGKKGKGKTPISETGIILPTEEVLSLGEKLKILYDKCRELTIDGLVSKFELADALEGQVDRNEVFPLLEILDKEGKIASKGPEWYRVV